MTREISQEIRAARRPLRLENCAWQRAAAGLLTLAVASNTLLYGLLNHREARHRAEASQLRQEVRLAEEMRDQAVQQLGALRLERQARAEQAAAYEAVSTYQYIGTCKITAYCSCEACCGIWSDGLTATGLPVSPGIVAVDPEIVPLGSTVIIDGQRYLAADTGVRGRHIDIYMEDHTAAEAFGVQEAAVWAVEP